MKDCERSGHTLDTSPLHSCMFSPALDQEKAAAALVDLRLLIAPLHDLDIGHKDLKLDLLLCNCLEKMQMFLWMYIDLNNPHGWQDASLRMAKAHEKGGWLAGGLQEWARAYILDQNDLPLKI